MSKNIGINEEEYEKDIKKRKKALKEKLEKIIIRKISDTEMIVKTNGGGGGMKINTDYDVDEYGVKVGEFAFYRQELRVWVGVSKEAHTVKVDNAMWCLAEGNDGILHCWGKRAKDFNEDQLFVLNV